MEAVEARRYLAFSAHINFQPASSTVPTGYLIDSGKLYADRGNGLTYGWSTSITSNTADRNSTLSPDQRYDTLIRAASREELRLAWEAARKIQGEQEMGSEAWASARRLSELLRGEYQASELEPSSGVDPGD